MCCTTTDRGSSSYGSFEKNKKQKERLQAKMFTYDFMRKIIQTHTQTSNFVLNQKIVLLDKDAWNLLCM